MVSSSQWFSFWLYCTPAGEKVKAAGQRVLLSGFGAVFENDQNLNRFTIRSHRRVKKLPDWVVVSVSAVLVAAATVSPVL